MTAEPGPNGPDPQFRRPERSPSRTELQERDRFAAFTTGSLETVRSNAQIWRTGLAAFITLVTTGIVIKGPDTTAGLDVTWLIAVTILIGTGLILAVVGLWLALAAEAGTDPRKQTLADIRSAHGSLDAYLVALADNAAQRLAWGRRAVGCSVALLILGIAATWWAPEPPSSPPAYLRVSHGTDSVACGTLLSADEGQLRLKIKGAHQEAVVPLTEVTNLAVTADCFDSPASGSVN